MKDYFIVSICKNGILGGGIVADDEAITYKTNKLTVSPALRNLRMPYAEIDSFVKYRRLLFPMVAVNMKNGERYAFIVFFTRKKFCALLEKMGVKEE